MTPPELDSKAAPSDLPQLFAYSALASDGSRVEGQASARDEVELDRQLEREGLTLLRARPGLGSARRSAAKLNHAQLVSFTTQFATLLEAGVPMVAGLRQLAKRSRGSVREVVERIVRHLEMGFSLSEALETQPHTFPRIYRAAVRAGEHSMELPSVLARQAAHMRWMKEIRSSVGQALVYPAVLLVAVSGLVVILLTFLLPRLATLFPKDAVLPWQTRMVMSLSSFLAQHGWLVGAGLLTLGLCWVCALRWRPTRSALSRALLALPRLGELMRMVSTARFASTASDLHSAGCDVMLVLSVASESCGCTALKEAFERVLGRVRQGYAIAESLEREPLVDPLLTQLVGVGEASGELDGCLRRLADCYDEEVPRKVKWAMSLMEPIMLACAAIVVGFILMAALLPILDLYESIA